jgi:hypothetical protein
MDQPYSARPYGMTIQESAVFETFLSSSKIYLEFGCGTSTRMACSHVKDKIFSVDNNPLWVKKIRSSAELKEDIASSKLQLIYINTGPVGPWGFPETDSSHAMWPEYYLKPWTIIESRPDTVFVDGRFRLACALASLLSQPSPFDLLIHDYKPNRQYNRIEAILGSPTLVGRLAHFQCSTWSRSETLSMLGECLFDPR